MGFSPTMAIQYHLQTIEITFWADCHLTASLAPKVSMWNAASSRYANQITQTGQRLFWALSSALLAWNKSPSMFLQPHHEALAGPQRNERTAWAEPLQISGHPPESEDRHE
jgi:hypothetical protein